MSVVESRGHDGDHAHSSSARYARNAWPNDNKPPSSHSTFRPAADSLWQTQWRRSRSSPRVARSCREQPRASDAARRDSSPPARSSTSRKSIFSGFPKPAMPALFTRMSIGPSFANDVDIRVAGDVQLQRRDPRELGSSSCSIRIPAAVNRGLPGSCSGKHFTRARFDKRATSVRPRPRLAPVINTRLPSICICVNFRTSAPHARELIQARARRFPKRRSAQCSSTNAR